MYKFLKVVSVVILVTLVASGCAQNSTLLGSPLPAPETRLLTDSKVPELSGDKGVDAARFATAYVIERRKTDDWQEFYCSVYAEYSGADLTGCPGVINTQSK